MVVVVLSVFFFLSYPAMGRWEKKGSILSLRLLPIDNCLKKKKLVTYRSEAVGDFIADNVNTTVTGDGNNRLQVSEINTYMVVKYEAKAVLLGGQAEVAFKCCAGKCVC